MRGSGEMGERQKMLVLYATQTGNAQDVAERVGREAARHHFKPVVESMHLYDANELPQESVVVFVVSTTGQGEPPQSMRAFWRSLLRRSLGHRWLESTLFAVFGLGDSGYQKYNVTGKKLDRRLLDLGGQAVVPRGLGDDQHPSGFEAGLDPWLAELWVALRQHVPLPAGLEDRRPDETGIIILDPPKYRVTYYDSRAPESNLAAMPERSKTDIVERWIEHGRARAMVDSAGNPFGNAREHNSNSTGYGPPSMPVFAKLLTNSRITSEDHDQDVRHIELELGSSGTRYVPGDILTLLPCQNQASIDKFVSRCGLDGDTLVTVEAANSDVCTLTQAVDVEFMSEKTVVSLRTIVEALMDIDSASPRRYFFEVMSHFAEAEHEKERLQYFSTPEGRDDLYRYNQRERRTVLEVLEDFPSVQLPFEWLLQTVPRLQQRSFSISSSPLAHPNEAHLTVAVVEWTTPFKRKRRGLCSSWLASLDPKQGKGKVFLPVWFTKGAISLPSPSVPLILVGPGTGCAPFRSFIQERIALLNKGEAVAPVLFFFGCRYKSKDLLYGADWSAWSQGQNVLSVEVGGDFFVAFSRDQLEKIYVQHKITEQGKKVLQMMQSGAAIYVAGSADKMPADVLSAFESVIAKETGWPQDSVSKYLRDLERKGRYVVEAWS
ncbi:hypothetical protein M758_12G050000 [Ceratodon purpureus]|nr:hypothetical protein M758_12G050000 [Ceratodon purpureus]